MKNKKEISKPSIRLFTIQKQESQRKLKELQSLNCVSQNLSKEHFITDSSTNDSPKFWQTKVISKASKKMHIYSIQSSVINWGFNFVIIDFISLFACWN